MKPTIVMQTMVAILCWLPIAGIGAASMEPQRVELPAPVESSTVTVEQAIAARRSVRQFVDGPLPDAVISRLLWSAQGITEPTRRLRAAPSAGATYPLELYLVDHRGVFRYVPDSHGLEQVAAGDRRAGLARAALGQAMIQEAPISFVITAVPQRTAARYGRARAERYVHMEAGHAAQNLHLQAVALNLGSVPVGAFRDREVQNMLGISKDHEPLYIIAVGPAR
jgi:SagB-type dehydrogenase family enzyme